MKKKAVILSAVLIVLMIPAILLNGRKGVYMGESFYMPHDNRDNSWVYRSMERYEVTLDWSGEGTACYVRAGVTECDARLTWTDDWAHVEFDDGTVVEGYWTGTSLVSEEGTPVWLDDEIQIVVSGQPEQPLRKYSVAAALCRMDRKELDSFGSIWVALVGAVIYILGALNILIPEKMHFFGSRWRYAHAELSDEGYAAQVFSGIVTLICGVIFMYLPLFA